MKAVLKAHITRPVSLFLLCCCSIVPCLAQPGINVSIGRGAPDPLHVDVIVGADGRGYNNGPFAPEGGLVAVVAAENGAVPEGIEALPRDLFTSDDFYIDTALWMDKRYFRCNSPMALEAQWGATETPVVGDNPPYTAAWGYCDRDYPRAEIVSPYPFRSAQAHYEALLADTQSRGGPTRHSRESLPDWNGNYARQYDKRGSWFDGAILQIPTYLSLLTPDYQRRYVQQMYHYGNTNAAQWPGSYCWPEGFLRRMSYYGGIGSQFMVTPEIVQDLRRGAQNILTQINIGREFNLDGPVPVLGADVPRWYGETIGFWEADTLITWTANVQGWITHGSFEFSNKMQSIEIYSPNYRDDGSFLGFRHEVILYDEEALVDPVRIIEYMDRVEGLSEGDPYDYIECLRNIYPVDGRATQVTLDQTIEYTLPDMYGRPWAQIWEKYFEQNMQRPEEESFFEF